MKYKVKFFTHFEFKGFYSNLWPIPKIVRTSFHLITKKITTILQPQFQEMLVGFSDESINTFIQLRWNWTELKVLRINSKAIPVETLIWNIVYYTKNKGHLASWISRNCFDLCSFLNFLILPTMYTLILASEKIIEYIPNVAHLC